MGKGEKRGKQAFWLRTPVRAYAGQRWRRICQEYVQGRPRFVCYHGREDSPWAITEPRVGGCVCGRVCCAMQVPEVHSMCMCMCMYSRKYVFWSCVRVRVRTCVARAIGTYVKVPDADATVVADGDELLLVGTPCDGADRVRVAEADGKEGMIWCAHVEDFHLVVLPADGDEFARRGHNDAVESDAVGVYDSIDRVHHVTVPRVHHTVRAARHQFLLTVEPLAHARE